MCEQIHICDCWMVRELTLKILTMKKLVSTNKITRINKVSKCKERIQKLII